MALALGPKGVSAPQSDTSKTQAREDQGPKGYTALSPCTPGSLEKVYPGRSKTHSSDFVDFSLFPFFVYPAYIFFSF